MKDQWDLPEDPKPGPTPDRKPDSSSPSKPSPDGGPPVSGKPAETPELPSKARPQTSSIPKTPSKPDPKTGEKPVAKPDPVPVSRTPPKASSRTPPESGAASARKPASEPPKRSPEPHPAPRAATAAHPTRSWREKLFVLGQTVLLLLILALHIYSTVDNFRFGTGVKFVCLLTSMLALFSGYHLFKAVGPGPTGVFVFSLFLVPIAYSAIFPGSGITRGFTLAGMDTGFWAGVSCLGTIVVMLGWLYTRELAGFLKHALAVPILYCALGFIVGLVKGAPLDLVVLGTGFLGSIPFGLQPASLYLNLGLPLVLLIILGRMGVSILHGEIKDVPKLAGAGVFFLLPFVMGIATMNRYLIPNISFLVLGKPVGAGYVKISYTSTWDENDTGTKEHEVEISTRGYKPGGKSTYLMSASVVPPNSPDEETSLKLTIKDPLRGVDVINLKQDDFTVLEDGKKQTHKLFASLDRKAFEKLQGRSVILDLDTSGSMSGHIADLRQAALSFVRKLVPGYEVSLYSFNSKITRHYEGFSIDLPKIEGCIQALQAGGGTALYDSVFAVFDELEAHSGGTGIVVLFSDGADSGSNQGYPSTLERIKNRGIQVFAIGFGSGMEPTSSGGKILSEMASVTGGKYFHAKDAVDLEKIFGQVFDFISCKYSLAYKKDLPPPPTIEILDPKPGTEISKPFDLKVQVKGAPEKVELLLDTVPLRTFLEKREGTFEHKGENPDDHDAGKHTLIARVKDIYGRNAEAKVEISIKRLLPQVAILEPPDGAAIWKDATYRAKVTGQFYKKVVFNLDGKAIKEFPQAGPEYFFPLLPQSTSPGPHSLMVEALMSDGRKADAVGTFKFFVPKPRVAFLSPGPGAKVYGKETIAVSADSGWHETALKVVRVSVDGKELAELSGSGMKTGWDTEPIPEGEHVLKAVVENEIGQTAEAQQTVQVIKPKFFVSVNGISPGQVIRNSTKGSLTIVNEQPGTTIVKVEVGLDGKVFKTMTKSPWEFDLDILRIPEGEHELKAEVFRSDGKSFQTTVRFRVNPPKKVVLYFSTRDDKGKYTPTPDIQKLPLGIREDGKDVKDYTLDSAAQLPINFGLVIDISGSMKNEHRLEKAKDAAVTFVDLMKGNDKAFLIKFSDSPQLAMDFSNDRRKLQQEIEYLVPQNGTALYDAVFMGVEKIRSVTDRPAIVVLTDGVDENNMRTGPGSVRTLQEVVDAARRQDVQIFCIGLGREMKMRDSRGERVLRTLASSTGGSFFFAPSAGELEEVFRGIMREVGSQSKLSFVPPSGGNDGNWHTIEIGVPSRKDLTFIYKPTYLAQ